MFTSCGVAGFQPQYQVQAPPPGPPPGLGVSRQVQTGLGATPQVTPGVCPAFQGQAYVGPLFSASSAAAFNGASVVTLPTTRLPMPPLPPPPPPPPTAALTPGGQGGFKKVCRTEDDGPCPFPGLAAGVLEMRVKEGSKIRNLMGFAMARMQGGGGGGGATGGGGGASDGGGGGLGGLRQVVFTGSGRAVTKTITCAEIMKRKVGGLHQMTKLRYKGVREVWESQEGGGGGGGGGGASEMTVHKTVPSISILLSKDPLDPQEPGYQPPQTLSALWEEREGAGEVSPPTAAKRPLGLGLGLAPHTGYPHSKRVCLGEGSILTPR